MSGTLTELMNAFVVAIVAQVLGLEGQAFVAYHVISGAVDVVVVSGAIRWPRYEK